MSTATLFAPFALPAARIPLVQTIAFDPHDGGGGQNLLDQIEAMQNRRGAKVAGVGAETDADADADQ